MSFPSRVSHLSAIGFIGLGGMGSRMAARLIADGYHVTVYNRTSHRGEELRRLGASVAGTPRLLAEASDVVLSSVTDDGALEEVMYGADGALLGARPGAVVIDMSTVHPETSAKLFEAGRLRGVDVIDAPVSGSLPQAAEGQLVVFVGGEPAVHERCLPLLRVLGKAVLHMGPAGSGATTKLCVNALLGLGMQSLAEALALGERAGLPRERLLAAFAQTPVISPSQRSKFENVIHDQYPAMFPQRLMFKDFSLILQRALELAVAMPATAAAAQAAAAEHVREESAHVDDDLSAIVRGMR